MEHSQVTGVRKMVMDHSQVTGRSGNWPCVRFAMFVCKHSVCVFDYIVRWSSVRRVTMIYVYVYVHSRLQVITQWTTHRTKKRRVQLTIVHNVQQCFSWMLFSVERLAFVLSMPDDGSIHLQLARCLILMVID